MSPTLKRETEGKIYKLYNLLRNDINEAKNLHSSCLIYTEKDNNVYEIRWYSLLYFDMYNMLAKDPYCDG